MRKRGRQMHMRDRFEHFTERAKTVMSLAQEEAQRFNHNYIGTEHILLGLVREGDGVAAKMLANLGVELQQVRRAVEQIIGQGDRLVMGEVGLTPRSKQVIEYAVDEARRLNHHYVGTEHLLLGLLREGSGIAAGVLESLGVSLGKARQQLEGQLARGVGRYSVPLSDEPVVPPSPAPKSNVVTCRLDDASVNALDALVEAGIRSTRSDAAAWLISAGIEAHRELFDRVNATVNEIRKLRQEAQDIARRVANGNPDSTDNPSDATDTPDTPDASEGEPPSA